MPEHLLESRWGIDFYYASNEVCHVPSICSITLPCYRRSITNLTKQSGLSANWQCWKDDKGVWTFDISEVAGPAGGTQIKRAVNNVLLNGVGPENGSDKLSYCFGDLC